MEISEEILEFLNREDVQDALAQNNTQELYKLAVDANERGYLSLCGIGKLTSILIQAGIDPLLGTTEIPVHFLSCQKSIRKFNIPEGVTKINGYAFRYTGLKSITIPDSVKVIGRFAFSRCENLKTVELPIGVELYEDAFSFSGLESVELKDVKLQGYFIFEDCGQLKSVIIKGDTPVIPAQTFENCIDLTHIELPETLKQIEYDVFNRCDKLREINFAGIMEQWREIEIHKSNTNLFSCKIICSDGVLRYNKTIEEWK